MFQHNLNYCLDYMQVHTNPVIPHFGLWDLSNIKKTVQCEHFFTCSSISFLRNVGSLKMQGVGEVSMKKTPLEVKGKRMNYQKQKKSKFKKQI